MSQNFFRRPLGLVLSGGGALGSWQGALVHSLEKNYGLTFDSVMGFSAGALTGVNYFLNRMDDVIARWRNVRDDTMRFSPRLFPLSLFSPKPIWEAIDYTLNEEEMKKSGRCRFVVASATTQRSRYIYAAYTPRGKEGWDAPLARHIVASCSIPVVFPPTRLAYRGQSMSLMDGGVICAEPFSFEALHDCQDVIVAQTIRPEEFGQPRGGIWDRLDKRGRDTILTLMNQGIASLRNRANPPRVFQLPPSKILGFKMLQFHGPQIAASLAQGAADAAAFMEKPQDFQV